MTGRYQKLVSIAVSLIGTILIFQNCSEGFKAVETMSNSAASLQQSPVVTFLNAPTMVASADVTFNFDVTGTSVESIKCQVTGGAVQDCASKSISFSGLPDGDYTLDVSATGTNGLVGTNRTVFRKDSTPPVVNVTATPSNPSAMTSGSFTFAVTDNLSGVASVECSRDNSAFAVCTSPAELTDLAVGSHNFKIRATDMLGNMSIAYSYDWNVTAPGVPSVIISTKLASYINTNSVSVAFVGSEVASYECKQDSGAYSACTSPKQFSGLTSGAHSFSVRGVIAANSYTAEASVATTVDLKVPSTPNIVTTITALTNLKSASFNFSSTDENGISKYECALDDGAYAACTSPNQRANIPDGPHSFKVQAYDVANNKSAVATFNFTVDSMAPTLKFNPVPPSTISDNKLTISFTATDSGSGLKSVQCAIDDAAYADCSNSKALTGLSVGGHAFKVQATDNAGNMAVITHNFTVSPVVDPLVWNVLPAPEFVVSSNATYDLKPTLPMGVLMAGGKFGVDPSGAQLPSGMTLNPDTGILSVASAAVGETSGVIFTYTTP